VAADQLVALRAYVQHEGLREITGDQRGIKLKSGLPPAEVVSEEPGELDFATNPQPEFKLPPRDQRGEVTPR